MYVKWWTPFVCWVCHLHYSLHCETIPFILALLEGVQSLAETDSALSKNSASCAQLRDSLWRGFANWLFSNRVTLFYRLILAIFGSVTDATLWILDVVLISNCTSKLSAYSRAHQGVIFKKDFCPCHTYTGKFAFAAYEVNMKQMRKSFLCLQTQLCMCTYAHMHAC